MASHQSGSQSKAGEAVVMPGFAKVTEGCSTVFFPPPKDAKEKAASEAAHEDASKGDISVFYNPPQVVNRDLSVCALQCFARMRREEAPRKGGTKDGLVVLEALSASGLRAIRYWNEVEGLRTIVANDLDPDAAVCIERNCTANGVPLVTVAAAMDAERVMRRHRAKDTTADVAAAIAASTGVIANRDDAIALMQRAAFDPALYPDTLAFVDPATGAAKPCWAGQKFDVVDLDPYGSAAPFIDSAIASAREGALLLVTSTDSAVLCGNYSETCHAKYGSTGIKTVACHEMAVRILLAALERAAARQGKSIVPLVSLHIDFYIRVFVRVYTSAADAKMACCKLGLMVQCAQCPNHYAMPLSRPRGGRSKAQEAASRPAPPAAAKGEPPAPPQNFPAAPSRSDLATNLQCEAFGDYVSGSTCECCGGRLLIGGPIYCAPTQDRAFIAQLLAEIESRGPERLKGLARIKGMLVTAASELPEVPLFYSLPELSSRLRMHCPPAPIVTAALARLGYRCSQAHSDAVGFKTDAPCRVLLGLLLRQKANTPDLPGHEQPDGAVVVPAPFTGRVEPLAAERCDFTYDAAYDMRGAVTGVAKFVVNAPFWGPRARHRGALRHERDEDVKPEEQEGSASTA